MRIPCQSAPPSQPVLAVHSRTALAQVMRTQAEQGRGHLLWRRQHAMPAGSMCLRLPISSAPLHAADGSHVTLLTCSFDTFLCACVHVDSFVAQLIRLCYSHACAATDSDFVDSALFSFGLSPPSPSRSKPPNFFKLQNDGLSVSPPMLTPDARRHNPSRIDGSEARARTRLTRGRHQRSLATNGFEREA